MLCSLLFAQGLGCAPPPAEVRPKPQTATLSVAEEPLDNVSPTPLAPMVVETYEVNGVSVQDKAEPLSHWIAEHAFIASPIIDGHALGPNEAIALTQDNLVGITKDQGTSWRFTAHPRGAVSAVGGRHGGPYLTVGPGGSMTVSSDGLQWTELPRYTGDNLITAEVLGDTAIALGSRGTIVRASLNGANGQALRLPDDFIPSSLTRHGEGVLASHGSRAFHSDDGVHWEAASKPEDIGVPGVATTSRGICKLGRVGLRRGVSCSLYGVAHGVGDRTFVVSASGLTVSADGGATWQRAAVNLSSIHRIIHSTSGQYFALGAQGGLAYSDNGVQWSSPRLESTHTLRDGIADRGLVILVGDMGTILRSEDSGATWSVVPTKLGATLKSVVAMDGRLVASGSAISLESKDRGVTWRPIDAQRSEAVIAPTSKRQACAGRLPADGQQCVISLQSASPTALPNMTGLHFKGEAGIAFGESGLVAFTSDGGKHWTANHGLGLQSIESLKVRGKVIVALNRTNVAVSNDSGTRFHLAALPSPMIGGFLDAHITATGAVYISGKKGFIVKSEGPLTRWLPLNTGERNTVQFERLFEVDGNLYAAGKRGVLLRSADDGASWRAIPLGLNGRISAMSGRGDSVMAVMTTAQDGGWLLISHDGGAHFAVQQSFHDLTELQRSTEGDFDWDGSRIHWAGKTSSDGGVTWEVRPSWIPTSQDLGDGFTAFASHGRLLVSGPEGQERAEIVLPINGSRFTCRGGPHCWLIDGKQVYRSRSRM